MIHLILLSLLKVVLVALAGKALHVIATGGIQLKVFHNASIKDKRATQQEDHEETQAALETVSYQNPVSPYNINIVAFSSKLVPKPKSNASVKGIY